MTTIYRTEDLPAGICVLSDGGCHNNNKPVSERKMYGSFVVYNNRRSVVSEYMDKATIQHAFTYDHDEERGEHASNQLAEMFTLWDALVYVEALQKRYNKPLTVTVLCDSEYALGHAQTWKPDKKAHADTVQASAHLKRAVETLREMGATLNFQHVDNLWVKTQLGH